MHFVFLYILMVVCFEKNLYKLYNHMIIMVFLSLLIFAITDVLFATYL